MIIYEFKGNLSATESLANLTAAFGDQAPEFNWFAEFRRGRRSLEDEQPAGRPASVVTEETFCCCPTADVG